MSVEGCCTERPNYGHPACNLFDAGIPIGFIAQSRRNENGEVNSVNLDGLTYDWFFGLMYTNNTAQRLYNLPLFKDFAETVADTSFKEAKNGEKAFIKEGLRSYSVEFWEQDATPTFYGKLKQIRCKDTSIYILTDKGFLIGYKADDKNGIDSFFGLPIGKNSLDPKWMNKTDDDVQKVMLGLDIDRNFDMSKLYAVDMNAIWDNTDEVVKSVSFTDLPQVIDVQLTNSAFGASVGGDDITINDDYRQGSMNPNTAGAGNVVGLLIGSFDLNNITTGLPVSITSVTETIDGTYTFVWTAQTAGDVLELIMVFDDTASINYDGKVRFTVA